jgi:hypothetical protein
MSGSWYFLKVFKIVMISKSYFRKVFRSIFMLCPYRPFEWNRPALSRRRKVDSATWYSTHTCSTLLRFNSENGVII